MVSEKTIKLKEKILDVVTVSGVTVKKKDTIPIGGKYYQKWTDITKYTDRTDIVIATKYNEEKKEWQNWRKLVENGGKYAWCETTSRFENVVDGNFVNATVNGKKLWLTQEAANCLPYYYRSRNGGQDWQSSGTYRSMEKVYFLKHSDLPSTVKLSPLCGDFIDSVNLGVPSSTLKQIFEPYSDDGGYRNQYQSYFRNSYKEFNTGHYGQAGNNMFDEVQQISDKFAESQSKVLTSHKIYEYEKFFEDVTIGAEIEAFSGFIPESACFDLGLIPVKDGSLNGRSYEYITTVIRKYKLPRLLQIFKLTNSILGVDKSCALQYHFGGLKTSKESIVAMYKAWYLLRNEIFMLMAPYRRHLDYFKTKKEIKDHCQELPAFDFFNSKVSEIEYEIHVNNCFNTIVRFLNDGETPTVKHGKFKHCKEGRPKWEWKSRYYMVNFLPLLFEEKQTVEIRPFAGTANPYKGLNILFICNAIFKYAETNKTTINKNNVKLNLLDVVEEVYGSEPKLAAYLQAYIKNRKDRYNELYIEHNLYGDEFMGDSKFVFKNNNWTPYD